MAGRMEITVRGRHEHVPQSLQEFAVRKLEHLGRYLSTITSIDVELYEDGSPKTGNGRVARVTVSTSGPTFRSKVDSTDLRASIDIAYERLERKLKEFKRKRSGRPPHSRPKASPADIGGEIVLE
jgi:ribosomal subunit interface protein